MNPLRVGRASGGLRPTVMEPRNIGLLVRALVFISEDVCKKKRKLLGESYGKALTLREFRNGDPGETA